MSISLSSLSVVVSLHDHVSVVVLHLVRLSLTTCNSTVVLFNVKILGDKVYIHKVIKLLLKTGFMIVLVEFIGSGKVGFLGTAHTLVPDTPLTVKLPYFGHKKGAFTSSS